MSTEYTCVIGHCGWPDGCENDGRCRANSQAPDPAQTLSDEQIAELLPEADGTAEHNKVAHPGGGYEYDEVPAWSFHLVAQTVRAALAIPAPEGAPDMLPGDYFTHSRSGKQFAAASLTTANGERAAVVVPVEAFDRATASPAEGALTDEQMQRQAAAILATHNQTDLTGMLVSMGRAVEKAHVQPKGMPAEWLDAFEEWRQTLGAADLDGKRDLVWRHIAGTGFQAGAAWARSQAPAPAHDRKAQALALCHALEEQPGSQYQTAAVLAAFKVYRAFESIEKHGEIRQWVFDVAAPCAAVAPAIANSHYEVAKIGDALAPPSIDDVLTLADAHAEESHENGDRRFDRGGLYQFAKELLTKQKAIGVEVVGVVRPGGEDGAEVEWLLEGGLHAVAEGGETYLLVSHEPITNDDGYGEVYRASQPPVHHMGEQS